MELLLENGANPNIGSKKFRIIDGMQNETIIEKGSTSLHEAACGYVEIAELLINKVEAGKKQE